MNLNLILMPCYSNLKPSLNHSEYNKNYLFLIIGSLFLRFYSMTYDNNFLHYLNHFFLENNWLKNSNHQNLQDMQ